jgi:hypothetical protein
MPEPNQETARSHIGLEGGGAQKSAQEHHPGRSVASAPEHDESLGGGFIPDEDETLEEATKPSLFSSANAPRHTNNEQSLYSLIVVSADTNPSKPTNNGQNSTRLPEALAPESRDKEGCGYNEPFCWSRQRLQTHPLPVLRSSLGLLHRHRHAFSPPCFLVKSRGVTMRDPCYPMILRTMMRFPSGLCPIS